MAEYDYDLITIGGGSGGVRASRFSAQRHGKKVAIIENLRIGGTCVMRGCVPKKLLVYGAHFADDFEDAAGYGWTVNGSKHDWPKLMAAKQKELNRLEDVYHRLLREAGVDEITGTGKLVDAHTVDVNGKTCQEGNLNQMIWKIPEVITYLSELFTLQPGDLIMIGTPAGVGPVLKGDVLEGHVQGLSSIKITVT